MNHSGDYEIDSMMDGAEMHCRCLRDVMALNSLGVMAIPLSQIPGYDLAEKWMEVPK